MNETFDDKIISKIKTDHVQPISKWYFTTRNWLLITLTTVAVILSSAATALILFLITDHDWFAVSYLDEGLPFHILKTIPYVWLTIIFIVVVFIYSTIRKIGRGYRYSPRKIIGYSLLISLALGTLLFFTGTGEYLDNYFEKNVSVYDSIIINNRDIWIYPEQGLLSGEIITSTSNSIAIVDDDGQPWDIDITSDTTDRLLNNKPGQWIKIVGNMSSSNHFTAAVILPWKNERK